MENGSQMLCLKTLMSVKYTWTFGEIHLRPKRTVFLPSCVIKTEFVYLSL